MKTRINIAVFTVLQETSQYLLKILNQYSLYFCTSEPALNDILSSQQISLIIVDVSRDVQCKYDACTHLRMKDINIPIICLTNRDKPSHEIRSFQAGADDFVRVPIVPHVLRTRVKHLVAMFQYEEHLKHEVERQTTQIQQTQDITIYALASLGAMRDMETGEHLLRTQQYIKALTIYLSTITQYKEFFTQETTKLLSKSGALHDIGKIGIPDVILQKPGKLTKDEMAIMRKHTVYGYDAIVKAETLFENNSSSRFLLFAKEITRSHHERWDCTGYPDGLCEDNIPLSGRIMAVADVYDALISKRVYKDAMSLDDAAEIILNGAWTQFDPLIVEAFINVREDFEKIAINHAN